MAAVSGASEVTVAVSPAASGARFCGWDGAEERMKDSATCCGG